MKRSAFGLCVCTALFGIVEASPPSDATPWTKSFLETRVIPFVDHYSLGVRGNHFSHASRHQTEGGVYATGALLPDWEFDLSVQGRSLRTRKFFARVEKMVFSDLEGDLFAATALLQASTSGFQRCRAPVFFEMARTCTEGGVGIGRHLLIQKQAYTQLFGYLTGGIGSAHARYIRSEIGLQQVFIKKHYVRLCLSRLQTFGKDDHPFRGIGTLRTAINSWEVSYAYRTDSGIETRLTFIRRIFSKGSLRTSTAYGASVSIPLSL